MQSHVLDFLAMALASQLVALHNNDGSEPNTYIWQIWSGMGLTGSEEISDATLYQLAEKRLIVQDLLAETEVVSYNRYKDDILILVDLPDRNKWICFFASYSTQVYRSS